MNETAPSGAADIETALETYAGRIRNRSLAVVVTDCLEDPEAIESGVAALARTDTDVLVVRVIAPDERDPDVVGDALFVEPESGDTRRSYFSSSLADTYRSRLDAHVDEVADRVTGLGEEHVTVDTGEEYFDAFARVWLQ